jgi:hypothetical protein
MEFKDGLSEDYREVLINYALRDLLGSDKGRYIMDALRESDPLVYSDVMLEATRRLQSAPELREDPRKSIQYLEELQVEVAREAMAEVEERMERMLSKPVNIRIDSTGKLLESVTVADADKRLTIEFDKGTKIVSATKKALQKVEVKQAQSLASPSHAVIVGPVYEFNAYVGQYSSTPCPVTVFPPAKICLAYSPSELPENTSSLSVAYYDGEQGWVELETVHSCIGEAGTATAELSLFMPFALLARLKPSVKLEVVNLSIDPSCAESDRRIAIGVKVKNAGNAAGNYNVVLRVNGYIEQAKMVRVAPGATQPVNFIVYRSQPGTYTVAIDEQQGSFTVVDASGGSVS